MKGLITHVRPGSTETHYVGSDPSYRRQVLTIGAVRAVVINAVCCDRSFFVTLDFVRTLRKYGFVFALTLGLAPIVFGCVEEDEDFFEKEETSLLAHDTIQLESFYLLPELLDDAQLIGRDLVPDSDDNPCLCNTEECREEWVEENLGCNLCISLRCEAGQDTHVCAYCDEF